MELVYADNNATTAVAPEVVESMMPFLSGEYFNPSSMYEASRPVAEAIKEARGIIAKALGGVRYREVLFTSCASESNNHAIMGTVRAAAPERRRIITTAVEHPAVLEVCKDLERQGYEVIYLSVNSNGELDVAEYVRALTRQTLLVTIMHANNETGVVFPIEQFSRLAKETDPAIVFHTDATQTMGKFPLDLSGALKGVDLLSFSGHKLHAPKGVGALFLRRGTACRPLLIGGHQEEGRRAGTENVPYIVGLGRAVQLAVEQMEAEGHVERLRDRLEQELQASIPHVQINGSGTMRLPNTSNISIHYVEGEGMLFQLSAAGICASSGSACTSGSLEPSHVLRAMKIPFTAVHGSVRFSFSRFTTDADVDRIVEVFPEIVANLRRLSPYWDVERDAPRE